MILPPDQLLDWYRTGRFPMADEHDGSIYLYDPDPRGIIPLEDFHVPKSLAKTIRSGKFEIRINTRFREVVNGCAEREETWISDVILDSYVLLHRLGYAHSVEVWYNGAVVGGLYGVAIAGVFFGESMFSRERDASKAALVALVDRMKARHMTLLDTQFTTPHLERFGAKEISRAEYRSRLHEALLVQTLFFP